MIGFADSHHRFTFKGTPRIFTNHSLNYMWVFEPTCFLCFTDCWVSMALLLQEVYHIIARINLKDSSCCAAWQSFPSLLIRLLMFVVWWPSKCACISRSISPKYRATQPARVYHCVLIQLAIELEHPCKSSWIFQRLRVPKNIHHCRSCSWCFPFFSTEISLSHVISTVCTLGGRSTMISYYIFPTSRHPSHPKWSQHINIPKVMACFSIINENAFLQSQFPVSHEYPSETPWTFAALLSYTVYFRR